MVSASIRTIAGSVICFIVASAGYPANTWQFWLVLLLIFAIILADVFDD
jgi:hypothetical protein